MDLHRCTSCGGWNRVAPDKTGPVCGRCKESLDTSGKPQDVDDDELAAAVAAAPVPVIVDFWAPWCGPCRAIAPVLDALARENKGKLAVLKVNSDENPGSSQQYGVRGIPTLVMFKDGREAGRQVGALPKPALEDWIRSVARG